MTPLVLWSCVALLGVGLVLLLARMTIGPTVLDRAVAFDVLVAFTVIGVCLHAASRRSTDNLILLVVLTLLGFVGSVAIARHLDPGHTDPPGPDLQDEARDDDDDPAIDGGTR